MIKKINIAIAGFGNIGSYFYKSLEKNKRTIAIKTGKMPVIKYISAKNFNKKRKNKIPKTKWISNPLSLVLKNDIDIIFCFISRARSMDSNFHGKRFGQGQTITFCTLPCV